MHMETYPNGTQAIIPIKPSEDALQTGSYETSLGVFVRTTLFNGDLVHMGSGKYIRIYGDGLVRGELEYAIRSGTTGVWAECAGQTLYYELYGGWVASLDELGNPNPFEK